MLPSTVQTMLRLNLRSALVAFAVALAVLGAIGGPASAQNNSDPVNLANGQIAICDLMGGTADVGVDRANSGVKATYVTCVGGWLGGMICRNYPSGAFCTYPGSRAT